MSERYECKPGCHCPMCNHIRLLQEVHGDWACDPGCTCPNCTTVRALGDAREAGRELGQIQAAFEDGYDRGRRS